MMDSGLLQRLSNQMSRGEIVLMTGAGFSLTARNASGSSLPTVNELRRLMWPLAFPNDDFDENSTLGDIFDYASRVAGGKLEHLLDETLIVNSSDLDDVYRIWLSMPWSRIYTLNMDDLDEAANRAFDLPRTIQSISALKDGIQDLGQNLLSIHLNGKLSDYPDVTFSQPQYGDRTAYPDAWYHHLVTDLASRPVVFVGSNLDESPLWHQIELRKGKDPRARELRPGSYLVTPSIPMARAAMLEKYNVQLVPMTQEEFAHEVLEKLGAEKQKGLEAITDRLAMRVTSRTFQRISEIRTGSEKSPGEFLLGREPVWDDITSGVAVRREFEDKLRENIDKRNPRLVVLTGTAGSGKSTTLMRLALELHAEGKNGTWLTLGSEVRIHALLREIRESDTDLLFVDDCDYLHSQTGPFLADLAQTSGLTVICAMRSTRFEQLEVRSYLENVQDKMYMAIPQLEDSDIGLLLDKLTEAGRLGQLRGKTRHQQEQIFRQEAGRQLLVAMIQATSGERFEEKIDRECAEIGNELGFIYATVAIATSLRTYLSKDEILNVIGETSNRSLTNVQNLINQKLLVEVAANQIRVRHRVIADRALDYYRKQSQLNEPLTGLLWLMATKVHLETPKEAREAKMLRRLMSHEFMKNLTSDANTPREAYANVEGLLDWNYHYYLQRGSYEVEAGDINLAKNFLEQARAMAPSDHMVQTEWAYMSLKRAAMNVAAVDAAEQAAEAITELEDAIQARGNLDSYPYHVLGSQGLSWVRRALISGDEKARYLSRFKYLVGKGKEFHPHNNELKQLYQDIEREYLMLAVITPDLPPGDEVHRSQA